jgi:hypothetical protein
MTFYEQLRLVQRMAGLIKSKATGSPENFAKRLEIPRSCMFRYLDVLKILGADIRYCKERQSYFFENDFEFKI